MADVDATGFLIGADGFVIPLLNTAQTEGTEEEIQTDTNYTVAAQGAGQYATQSGRRFVARSGVMTAENQMQYCYILGLGGNIAGAIPVGKTSVSNGPQPLPYPVPMESGMTVRGMANTATDREVVLTVATRSGRYHCFSGTPTGAGEVTLTSIITGQGIGQTLQGDICTHAFVSADGQNQITSGGGVYILNGAGTVVGAVAAEDTQLGVCQWSRINVPIGLSFEAVVRTDA
jgi:hypothetical protein